MPTAVLTKTQKHSKTEKGTEPLPLANAGLNKLLTEWNTAFNKAEDYWRKVVQYCGENEITNKQLEQGLIDIRGMAEVTAKNEAAKILKAAHIEEAVAALEDGATVDSVKKDILPKYEAIKGQKHAYQKKLEESEPNREAQLNKQLERVALLFIEDLQMVEPSDFVATARTAFKAALAKVEKKARKDAEASGNGEENEQEEEE
jgi:hypothetical protein